MLNGTALEPAYVQLFGDTPLTGLVSTALAEVPQVELWVSLRAAVAGLGPKTVRIASKAVSAGMVSARITATP
jgi:hypothetical protein